MMKNTVDIIVVTYNRIRYFNAFVVLLNKYTRHPFRLIVVDNGSTDGTRDLIEGLSLNGIVWKYVFTNENLPLARAFTEGFKVSEAEYVVTVADDMKPPRIDVGPCWLELLVATMEERQDVGCINFSATRRAFERFDDDYKKEYGYSVNSGLSKLMFK